MIDISTNTTTDGVIRLAGTALDFGRVERATCHQDGHTPEDDATHTVMLGLVACGLAARLGGGAGAVRALHHLSTQE